ncbi:MAG: SUMF1/EgtB/PvdO family nonheme iron enzyme [Planctomycetota bacterium]
MEGAPSERPVHPVRLDSFLLSPYEVTVEEYNRFVVETGYVSSSEKGVDKERQIAIVDMLEGRKPPDADMHSLVEELIASGGCFKWDETQGRFLFLLDCTWQKPQFEQTPRDPVVCMSWIDSIHFCNWLSRKEGLPAAYDAATGGFLDKHGKATQDVTHVKGYRLPTEAEWEYAAREGGKDLRFGNGTNIAFAEEINFNPGIGSYPYSQEGLYRDRTTPVGQYKPNRLGLYDMSGNAWEWCSDSFGPYGHEAQVNPVATGSDRRVLRGGRWGGDAREARVFHRAHFEINNRCNNSGFRLARSL